MNRPGSPCAFVLAMTAGIIACGLCAFVLTSTVGLIACCREDLFNPIPLSTTASMPVTNSQLHVSFRQPEGWTLIDSGNLRNGPYLLPYATYGLQGRLAAPTLRIIYDDSAGTPTSPDQLDGVVYSETTRAVHLGEQILGELRETIDGLPAGGLRYVGGGREGFRLRVDQLNQTNYFEWTSAFEYSHELQQIYRAMLPTIRLIPAPP